MYEDQVNQNGETNETALLRALITISVCLHELVHYADFEFDDIMENDVELGLLFEQYYNSGFLEFDENGNVIKLKYED